MIWFEEVTDSLIVDLKYLKFKKYDGYRILKEDLYLNFVNRNTEMRLHIEEEEDD